MSRRHYKVSNGVLPAGYAECEYIESTGTQYIKTSITGRSGLSLITEIEETGGYYDHVYIGSRKTTGERLFLLAANNASAYSGLTFNIGCDSYIYSDFRINNGRFYKVETNLLNNLQTIKVDGNEVYRSAISYSVNNGYPLFLFCCNNNGNPMYFSLIKLKHTTIMLEGNVVLNFIPCIRLSDNKPGMYDLCGSICPLTGTPFYVNSGTGEFLYQLKQ